MKQWILLTAVSVMAGCQGLPGSVTTPSSYFPLIEGGQWTYNVLSGTTVLGTLSENQSLVTTKDGVTTAHLRLNGNIPFGDVKVQSQLDSTLRATDTAIANIDDKGTETHLFTLPLNVGQTWKVNDADVSVTGNEDISVPAGAYRSALVVRGENKDAVSKVWLAQGVGVVRVEIDAKVGGMVLKVELATFKPTP